MKYGSYVTFDGALADFFQEKLFGSQDKLVGAASVGLIGVEVAVVVGVGVGPLYAILVGYGMDDPLGAGLGQFPAEGADAGLERAEVHG